MSNLPQKSNATGNIQKGAKGKIAISTVNLNSLTKSLGEMTLPRLFYQLVVFVLDGSGSMTYPGTSGQSKGEEVDEAVTKVIQHLQKSKNKASFDIAMWAYANESVEMLPITPAQQIDLSTNFNPFEYIDQWTRTDLEETLQHVSQQCTNYLKKHDDKNVQALILILSDGAIHNYESALEQCQSLQEDSKITVGSIFFESKEWQEEFDLEAEDLKNGLKALCRDGIFFTSTLDPEEVRKHMIKSISTVSKIN